MDQRRLGDTDLFVSPLGLGCATFNREIDGETSFAILDHALQRGITLIDTAEAYADGGSETVVGRWIADRRVRDRIVLATKVSGVLSPQRIVASAEASLRRLQTDRIDLFQLHVWDDTTPVEESLQALSSLVDSGKVRYVGCSNWRAWQVAKSLLYCQQHGLHPIRSVQPPYNLVQQDIRADLLPLCADQQLGVISYSPLAAGFLTGKYGRDQVVPSGTRFDVMPGHQPIYFTEQGFAMLERLEQIAVRLKRTQVELALAWAMQQPLITSVLIGARRIEHVDQAFSARQLKFDEPLDALFA